MKVIYKFQNGDVSEVEVDKKLYDILKEMDRIDYNTNQKETRCNVSLEAYDPYERRFYTEDKMIFDKEDEEERLNKAILTLTDEQQEILKRYFYNDETMTSIAKDKNVSVKAISKRIQTILRKLRKNF